MTNVGDTVITDTQSSVEESQTVSEAQTGDLNTPVTTSSDIPSFFGPSTVVEPPPISGKFFVTVRFHSFRQAVAMKFH